MASGEVEVVQLPRGLQALGDLLGVVQGQPPGDHLVGAQTHAQGEVGAHRLAHGRDGLQGEPQPVLELAPVLVAPVVGQRRHELPHQRAVPELQLHPVEAALAHVHRRLGEIRLHLVDVLDLHDLGRLAVEHVGHRRGRPNRQPRQAAAALLPVVVELGEDAGVVLVHRPGEPLVAGDDLRPEGLDEVLVGPVGGMHRLLLGDDEARPAPGSGGQIVRQRLRGQLVFGQVRQVR